MPLHYYRALLVHGTTTQFDNAPPFLILFPDLPGCVSAGDTSAEASKGALGILERYVNRLVASGDVLPMSSRIGAPLPAWMPPVGRPLAEMFFPVQVAKIARSVLPGPTLPWTSGIVLTGDVDNPTTDHG